MATLCTRMNMDVTSHTVTWANDVLNFLLKLRWIIESLLESLQFDVIGLIWDEERVDWALFEKHVLSLKEVTIRYDSDGKKSFFAAELQRHWRIKQRDSQNTLSAPVSNYFKCRTDVCSLLNSVPGNVTLFGNGK